MRPMAEIDSSSRVPAESSPAETRRRMPIEAFGRASVPQGLINLTNIIWRTMILIAGLLVLVWITGMLGGVAIALFASLIIAALGAPVQRQLARAMPPALATAFTLTLVVLCIALVITFVTRSIVNETEQLIAAAQQAATEIETWLRDGPAHMTDADVSNLIKDAKTWAGTQGTSFAKGIPSTLGNLGDFVTAASVAIFGSFFFLNSRHRIWKWAMTWVPIHVRRQIDDVGVVAWQALSGYTRGIILVAIADGVLVFVGLVILQVPLAPALAVLVMFGALIPVIGAPIATVFAAVIALATKGPTTALAVVALTVVVGSFDGDILQPLIMGRAVQLHPLAIVSVIAVGTLNFGIVGALVAVPAAATVYSIAKYLSGRMPAPRDMPRGTRKPRLPGFLRRFRSAEHASPAS